jgi:hypothetical protein
MISYRNDGNNVAAHGPRLTRLSGSRLTRRRVVDYCRVTATL